MITADVAKINMENVFDMQYMFYAGKLLQSANVSGWQTSDRKAYGLNEASSHPDRFDSGGRGLTSRVLTVDQRRVLQNSRNLQPSSSD